MCSHSVYRNKTEALLNSLEADQKKNPDESRGGWKDEPLRLDALAGVVLKEKSVSKGSI